LKIYTRKGDDGTTGLLFGGRVRKDDDAPRAYGALDEAQAVIGVARAEAESGGRLDTILVGVGHDLYVCMSELATLPANHSKLVPGTTLATPAMVDALEPLIDEITELFPPLTEFVIPGANRVSAALDVARTVVRRAEREVLGVAAPGSSVLPYLNRLSDLLWALARWQVGGHHLLSKEQS
jgi:cob(I)alamin adenosyltransferase